LNSERASAVFARTGNRSKEVEVDATQGYDEYADHIASAGEGADGLVRIELDGAGRLWDVVLDPRVTELTADELRTALFDAITEAQDGMPAQPSFASFENAVADIDSAAERRLAGISEALHDLSRRAVRR
jgi:DNA-binding protein YbaB